MERYSGSGIRGARPSSTAAEVRQFMISPIMRRVSARSCGPPQISYRAACGNPMEGTCEKKTELHSSSWRAVISMTFQRASKPSASEMAAYSSWKPWALLYCMASRSSSSREGKYSYTVPLPMPAASAISETFKSPSGRPCRSSFNTARNTAAFFSGKFIPLLPPR